MNCKPIDSSRRNFKRNEMQTLNSIKRVMALANVLSPVLCAVILIVLLGYFAFQSRRFRFEKKELQPMGCELLSKRSASNP